ncbi:SLATT domain-containing protein [Luteimicrobium subarcticum]|uniref:SLATT domain-containing protein n=1 Tax=Luteimicrobium subarcticum TaxID=620910 RepID=UPI000C250EF2|nr:SLATT domain-containing protein [Luteimicrobium subarcticum]
MQDGDIDGYRDTVKRELEDLVEDMLWTEKVHFAHAENHARVNLWLGLGSTIAASVAAATVVAKSAPTVTGIAALVAAIASGLLTFLKPKDAEQRHLNVARRLGALRVRARAAVRLDLSTVFEPDPQAWRDLVKEIAVEKAKIDEDAPATSERALRRARLKISAGHFEHESDQR